MSVIDRIIKEFSPERAVKRAAHKAQLRLISDHQRRYEGAAFGDRHSGWYGKTNESLNQMIHRDQKNLVLRSRNLAINNPYAKKAPKTIANNVIGSGIIPTPKGRSKSVVKQLKDLWKDWGESLVCDYDGRFNFYGLQKMAMRSVVIAGEILVIRKRVESSVNKFGLQILLLEGEYIDQTKHNYSGGFPTTGEYDYYGIRYNSKNKIVGYWIYDRSPLEGNLKSSLVDIKDIIHIFEVDRPQQNRGVPFPSATILKQRDLDDYEDAELLGKKAAACMPIFVTNKSEEGEGGVISNDDRVENLEPGTITYLKAGESVEMTQPPQNQGYSEYTKTQHRAIANGYGLTYEQYTGDLSNVNFSSGRMGWLEFQRQVDDWQNMLIIPQLCGPVYKWFLEAVETSTGINLGGVRVDWTAPRREMIDPVKETNALVKATQAGFTSWQEVVRQQGYNPDDVLKEITEDQNNFSSAGLMPNWTQFFAIMSKIQNATNKNKNAKDTQVPQ
ncbi:phage portal protein [Arachidicoccus terrestris]|uniref:phage portal protein n=1 Tax=Arachidicoccus terrestris TaxID=2875539 RepID=UPI001CC4708B|nr:phage portal protein [Arachidicoccus terrestris]UAY56258.1 phage portal protein [Arachidicoccus terrestris]